MIIKRSVPIGNQDIEIMISDEIEALSEARNSGKASIAILDKNMIPIELSKYACINAKDINEAFLRKVAYRFKGIPMPVAEDEEILIREFGQGDFIALQQEYQDLDLEEEKNLGAEDKIFRDKESYESYIAHQYDFFDFGIWGIFEKGSGVLFGKLGFAMTDRGLAFGYHIFRKYRNRSYAYRASIMALNYMIENDFAGKEVYLHIRKENIASFHLARKLQEAYKENQKIKIVISFHI